MSVRTVEREAGRRASRLVEVRLEPLPLEHLEPAITEREWRHLLEVLRAAAPLLLDGRRIWLVSSTAVGGGVADQLRSLVPYVLGAGIDARWVVVGGPRRFFSMTKELHNQLHGHLRRHIDDDARELYESTLAGHAATLANEVAAGDVVILHDPQTAGLAPALRDMGALVVWRSHVGTDDLTPVVENAWSFLLPYVTAADAFVFSRAQFVPPMLADRRLHVISPSIDPTGTKNKFMPNDAVAAILEHTGLVQSHEAGWTQPRFTRRDGAQAVVRHCAEVLRYGPPPRFGVDPLVLHIARWDRLKDPVGVLRGFAEHVLSDVDAHLVMAGPGPRSVADDPEAELVFSEVTRAWRRLSPPHRSRIQLALLPNEDLEENAAIVNALQRAADVVVKKSLEEGFGLGITEAMWKARPIVASRVGGIQQQIEHERSGLLIDDPRDLAAFGAAVRRLLLDETTARQLGAAAHRRASARFLHGRHLAEWLNLAATVVRDGARAGSQREARYSARSTSAT